MPEPPRAPRALFDQVLEYALYVPLGAALRLAEQVPELAAGGRALAGRQVENARAVGHVALSLARRRVEERLKHTGEEGAPATPPPTAAPAPRPARRAPARGRGAPGADGLAVPGYDALAASQVLPLLEGLSDEELEAVRSYEEAHRHRRTVLGRIAQIGQERRDGVH